MTAQAESEKYANFDAERHDREGLCLYKAFIPPPFLAACNHWESNTGSAATADQVAKHHERCFRPLGETWVSVKARALTPAPASGWQSERPTEPGMWRVSLVPDMRHNVRDRSVIDAKIVLFGGSLWVNLRVTGPLALTAPLFDGALWKRRETEKDPFANGGK